MISLSLLALVDDVKDNIFIPPKPSDKYILDTNNFQWMLIENEQEEMNDNT
jgi:hypothetical protein